MYLSSNFCWLFSSELSWGVLLVCGFLLFLLCLVLCWHVLCHFHVGEITIEQRIHPRSQKCAFFQLQLHDFLRSLFYGPRSRWTASVGRDFIGMFGSTWCIWCQPRRMAAFMWMAVMFLDVAQACHTEWAPSLQQKNNRWLYVVRYISGIFDILILDSDPERFIGGLGFLMPWNSVNYLGVYPR